MAGYKIVDAKKLDADLTSVANAIRKKAGTTAKMEFPAGFESAVKNIPSGGAELPKLTNPASATDLALDKQLIDQNGNRVTGTLAEVTDVLGLAKQPDSVVYLSRSKEVQITSGMYSPTDFIARSSIKFKSRVPGAEFGNAFAGDVVAGITFTSENGVKVRGTHVCKSEGGIDTSDATATEDQILKNRTAYARGEKLTGTIESLATTTITPGTAAQAITKKYIDGTLTIKGDSNLKAENIKKGVSIFGVDGSHECEEGVTLPELSNPGIASDVASGKELIDQNGNKVTGTLPDGGGLTLYGGTPDIYIEMKPGKPDVKGITLNAKANKDRIIRAGDEVSVGAISDQFGNARLEDVAKGKKFTSAAGLLVEGTMEAASGGGLAVKKGSTSSTTIDTGLSSIDYVVLLADSFSRTGLLQLLYRKPNNAISYILCTSYSYNSQKTELNHASMASSTLLTIDGGKVTWNGTGTSAFMSGASYMWLAFGTE